jgi:glycosyltransferase involved in cell wall biosynthesis
VHGINDYSIDGVTGFKCAPDDVNGFADAIEKMACNEGLRAKMSVNVKQMVERYSINHSMAAMKRIYDASERKHGKFKR